MTGQPGVTKWILSAASQDYVIGQFDGKQFTAETSKLKGHYGKGYYAAQTFSQIPDGRRVILFWMQAATPGMPFNQAMSIPLEVSLRSTPQGLRLCYQPVQELQQLRVKTHDLSKGETEAELADIDVCVQPKAGTATKLTVRGVAIEYDVEKQELRCQGMKANVPLDDGKLNLRVILDRTSLEIIAGHGEIVMPVPFSFADKPRSIQLQASGKVDHAQVHELRSIWK